MNGKNWNWIGLVLWLEQQDGDLIDAWFPSSDRDRWRAPNIGGGTGGTRCSVASGG
jgi:hypothetical protein